MEKLRRGEVLDGDPEGFEERDFFSRAASEGLSHEELTKLGANVVGGRSRRLWPQINSRPTR